MVALVAVCVLFVGGVSVGHARGGGGHGGGHGGHHGHGGGEGHHGSGRHGHGHPGGPWRAPIFAGGAGFIGGWPVWFPLEDEPPYGTPFPMYQAPLSEDSSALPYIQRDLPLEYWYYCRSPQGYYPFVGECPDGWIQVLPQPGPPWPPP